MTLTDVTVTERPTENTEGILKAVGLDYLYKGTKGDFPEWMEEAELTGEEILGFTSLLRMVWEARREPDLSPGRQQAYFLLFGETVLCLDEKMLDICFRGQNR